MTFVMRLPAAIEGARRQIFIPIRAGIPAIFHFSVTNPRLVPLSSARLSGRLSQEDIMPSGQRFLLELALDASQVSNFNPAYQVKVVAYPKQGEAYERIVNFSRTGQGSALFSFNEAPGALKLAIWPEAVSASDQNSLRTISIDVPVSSWHTSTAIKLPEVAITDYFWNWWLHLTRNFSVDRQPVCASGCPVFGSPISVYDRDGIW
jgi:hypothetical protein